jgi:hypothetical protein
MGFLVCTISHIYIFVIMIKVIFNIKFAMMILIETNLNQQQISNKKVHNYYHSNLIPVQPIHQSVAQRAKKGPVNL